jgi:aconitate hydratase
VTEYLDRAGLTEYLDELGFNLVGYGCTTCIGNSGPLPVEVSRAVNDADLAVVSVLSGNRNFEGRINPDVKMNYLASPPLCVAYALAGTMDTDLYADPLGTDDHGNDVYLKDIWPSSAEIATVVEDAVQSDMFHKSYGEVFDGDERWNGLEVPSGDLFAWDERSTYVRQPPFFANLPREPQPLEDIRDARVLAVLGDSITTDHISPAGSIKHGGPAAQYLNANHVETADFNSFGSRRGNHEVMMRGTFANIRLRNRLARSRDGGGDPLPEGGVTLYLADGANLETSIYEAAMRYIEQGIPLIVLAGKEYGSGSSRDWAAKGTSLLGVHAVIAESFERIHRSNLVGMGVLPLQFKNRESVASLGLTGHEKFGIAGIAGDGDIPRELTATADDKEFTVTVRIDTPKEQRYYRHGGILQFVLRQLLEA